MKNFASVQRAVFLRAAFLNLHGVYPECFATQGLKTNKLPWLDLNMSLKGGKIEFMTLKLTLKGLNSSFITLKAYSKSRPTAVKV